MAVLFGKTKDLPHFTSHLFMLTRAYIYNKLDPSLFGTILGIFDKPSFSKDDERQYPNFFKNCVDAYSDLNTDEIAIVQFEPDEARICGPKPPVREMYEKFNVSDMNLSEKLLSKMFFPGAPITEDRLVLTQGIVKEHISVHDTIEKLVKKAVFSDSDLNTTTFTEFVRRYYDNIVDKAMTKYSKSHKSDVRVKGTVAVIDDSFEMVPHLLGQYLVDKGVRIILSPVVKGGHYRMFKTYRPAEKDLTLDNYHTKVHKNFNDFVRLACIQEEIGTYDYNDNELWFTSEDIDSVCKLAKKIADGKYVFKLSTNDDDIVIKDIDDAIVSVAQLGVTRRKTIEGMKENVGVQLQSET
jgi:hypothetical protein